MSMFTRLVLFTSLAIATASPSTAEAGLLSCPRAATRYSGSWVSHHNGHHGRLCARVTREDCNTYRVRFCGTFLKIIPFVYSTPMTVTNRQPNGDVTLYGRSQLPLFGDFTCHARMNGCSFTASYRSASDHGRFVMQKK